jgi:hypothetical protein
MLPTLTLQPVIIMIPATASIPVIVWNLFMVCTPDLYTDESLLSCTNCHSILHVANGRLPLGLLVYAAPGAQWL